MKRRVSILIVAVSCLTLLLMTLPSVGISASAEWEKWKTTHDAEVAKLAVAAKIEGQVILYAGSEPKPFMEAVRDYFKEKYSVTVEFISMNAPEVWAKVRAEGATGKQTGDWLQSGSPVTRGVASEGFFARWVPPAALEPGVEWNVNPLTDQSMKEFDGKGFPICLFPDPQGIVINKDLVPQEKAPKTFKDLLDPFFKGNKISFNDPRVPTPGALMYLYMKKLYGQEYLEKLKAQGIILERSEQIALRQVASGRHMVVIGIAARMVKEFETAPVQLIYPDGVVLSLTQAGLLDKSPHPNAAKLYMNFLLTKQGQEMAAKFADRTPIRGDVVDGVAPIARLSGRKLLPLLSFEEDMKGKAQAREEAKELFK